jgi:23S rRNA (cytidine2498-2'-O)-methyltransferase
MGGMLGTCQPGYEPCLASELGEAGWVTYERGTGWVLCKSVIAKTPVDLAFAHWLLPEAHELRGETVNVLAKQAVDRFAAALQGEHLMGDWPGLWSGAGGVTGLSRRVTAVKKTFDDLLRRRLARVAKLASPEAPRAAGPVRGWFVYFTGFDRAFAGREAVLGGQRRMADNRAAPSRSYLKVEEAYGLLGVEPQPHETVVDLGAAPGGWSYSAARRGARVVAVDNGPLKRGALGHAHIEHRRADAFRFRPAAGEIFDWLFCDLVEEPHHVLHDLVRPWLERGWSRRFVINLKFGRADPLKLLQELRASSSPFVSHASGVRIRHLYHDREEFTVVGQVTS